MKHAIGPLKYANNGNRGGDALSLAELLLTSSKEETLRSLYDEISRPRTRRTFIYRRSNPISIYFSSILLPFNDLFTEVRLLSTP